MAEAIDIPAWIALFIGLYSLAASIGEWRAPGYWASMMADFERLPALRFVTGMFLIALGGAIYMANPWRPDDWLAVLVTILGGVMTLEGAVILAMGDRFLGFARVLLGRMSRFWTLFSAALGIALIAVAVIRI